MREATRASYDLPRLAAAFLFAGLLAGCAADTAAPVFLKGAGDAPEAAPPAHAKPARRVVVRPGQSLGGIAQQYHVSKAAIIAANRLQPPYALTAGQRLIIPAGAAEPPRQAAAPPPPPIATGRKPPAVIPLDGPAPPRPTAALSPPPPAAAPEPPRPAVAAAAPEPPAREAQLPRGAHLPWPVRGRVLAAYGTTQGGGRNDGINISAPRGAAVHAVDEGVVAYSGNEVRGYGNLVLVKHPSGFISAYAHCEELLVKRGDKVGRGQVIAKVGATGGVGEPQLHFELRRGKKAVDPREFLTPAPAAASHATPGPG